MAKKDNGIVIGGDVVERLVSLLEGGMKTMTDETTEKKKIYKEHEGFIRTELERIEERIAAADPKTDEYRELLRTYDQLLNVTRYW